MLYRVAAYTGYRAGELAALVPACFNLDAERPTIDLDGEHTKNGKSACQPIPPTWRTNFVCTFAVGPPIRPCGRERGPSAPPT